MKQSVSLILLLFLCFACSKENRPVVARVGKTVLTMEELYAALPSVEGQKFNRTQLEKFVQRWIESELLYQQAIKEKVDQDLQAQRALKKLEKEYIVSIFLEQKARQEIQITEQDLSEYFNKNIDEFKNEEDQYKLSLVLVETVEKAKEIRALLISGKDFSELAKSRSIDLSRNRGGDLGFVVLSRLSPMVAAAVTKMKTGEISAPIKSEVGYNIIRLEALKTKGQVPSLSEIRDQVAERVLAQRREEMYRNLISRLGEKVTWINDLNDVSIE